MKISKIARVFIEKPRAEVFEVAVSDETIAAIFVGYGPIPALTRSETDGEPRVGARREVTTAKGETIVEIIRELERPARHGYELVGGLDSGPGRLLRSAGGVWTFEDADGGTDVTWTFSFELRSALLWPLAAVPVACFGAAMRRALPRLKALIETGDPGSLP